MNLQKILSGAILGYLPFFLFAGFASTDCPSLLPAPDPTEDGSMPNTFLPRDTILCANDSLVWHIPDDYTCNWLDINGIVLPFGADTNTFVIQGKRGSDGVGGGTDTRNFDTYLLRFQHKSTESDRGIDTLRVGHLVQPTVQIPSDTLICRNEPVEIEPVLPHVYAPFYELSWENGSTDAIRQFPDPGMFFIRFKLKDQLNTCGFEAAADTISIQWVDPAMTDIQLPADTTICIDLTLTLDVTVPFDSTRYCWKTGNLPDPDFPDEDTVYYAPPRYTIREEGTYNITLTDSMGCKNAKEINVVIDECKPLLDIPNVFTPNGDGVNDILKFKQLEKCTDVDIEIVNRWGRIVLRKKVKNAEDFEWNGCLNNGSKKLPDGPYFYMVTYKNMYGKKKVQSGSITILGSTE